MAKAVAVVVAVADAEASTTGSEHTRVGVDSGDGDASGDGGFGLDGVLNGVVPAWCLGASRAGCGEENASAPSGEERCELGLLHDAS